MGLLLLGIALGIGAAWAYQSGIHRTSPAAEASKPDPTGPLPLRELAAKRSVFALGTLELAGGPILIASPLTGREIRKVLVHEGQAVKDGDILVELDSTAAEHELQLAKAQRQTAQERQQSEVVQARQHIDAAELAIEQARSGRDLERQSQQKQLDVAELKAKQAETELTRLEGLARGPNGAAWAQQVEHQKALVKLAQAERDAASTALARLEQSLQFNVEKAELEKKAAQEALALAERSTAVAALDKQIALAEHKLKQTKVVAPRAGTVISVLAHSGELVSTQPLLQLANLSDLECQAELDVADLSLIAGKRDALVSCRAFRGTKIKATIQRIRNAAGAATLRPVDPRKTVDRTVATVVLKVDAAEATQLVGGGTASTGLALIGLQVDVEIPL